MNTRYGVASALYANLILFGCAGVTAIPLDADGYAAVPGATPGFRYFLPRPYLLVTEIPESGGAPSGQIIKDINPPGFTNPQGTSDSGAPAPGAEPPKGGDKGDKGDAAQTTAQASAPNTNTSYLHYNPNYMVKLIYLPDYSRPMAVNMNAGLLGTASMTLTLQDGWMLTGATANADNSKAAEVLTAAISALTSGASGGASGAAKSASSGAKAPGAAPTARPANRALRPGLYAFEYELGASRISFICAVAYFGPSGARSPSRKSDPNACGPSVPRVDPAIISRLG